MASGAVAPGPRLPIQLDLSAFPVTDGKEQDVRRVGSVICSHLMAAFFIPTDEGKAGEDAYQLLRHRTEVQMGRPPSRRRIKELWTRRGSLDCITAVGAPDPIWGDVVTAIFDMGPHQPFVVYRRHPAQPGQHACDVLGCNAYSVSEFAA